MTRFEKHELSRKIVRSLSKIQTYKETISRIRANEKLFHSASVQIRLVGIKNTLWEDLTPEDSIFIIKRKIQQEQVILLKLEKQLK